MNNRRAAIYDQLQINFSNMLRMLRLMINSMIKPETYGLNCGSLKTDSPSSDLFENENINPKLFQFENMKLDNEKMKTELLMLSLNRTTNNEKTSSFMSVFENRYEVFKNQRNLIISKLIQLVAIERMSQRRLYSIYLDDLRALLASNLYLNHKKIEDLTNTNIDDFDAIFHLTLGIKNALQLSSINLT